MAEKKLCLSVQGYPDHEHLKPFAVALPEITDTTACFIFEHGFTPDPNGGSRDRPMFNSRSGHGDISELHDPELLRSFAELQAQGLVTSFGTLKEGQALTAMSYRKSHQKVKPAGDQASQDPENAASTFPFYDGVIRSVFELAKKLNQGIDADLFPEKRARCFFWVVTDEPDPRRSPAKL